MDVCTFGYGSSILQKTIEIHLEYVPYGYIDKRACQEPKNRSSSGIIDAENENEYENTIVLIRNPFETIYAIYAMILDHDKHTIISSRKVILIFYTRK